MVGMKIPSYVLTAALYCGYGQDEDLAAVFGLVRGRLEERFDDQRGRQTNTCYFRSERSFCTYKSSS